MPSAITFLAHTPHGLVLNLIGTGGVATQSRTIILGMCAAGPLRELLARTLDWTVFNLGGTLCGKVHVREIVDRAGGAGTGESSPTEFFWTANGVKADCVGTCQIEIRLQHTERF